jgi:hypothetical protein
MTDLKDRDEPRLKVIFDVESTPTRQRDWRTLEFEQVKQPATPTKVTELVVDNVMGPDLVVEDTPRLGHPQRERIVGVRESLANVGMLATLVGMGSRPRRGAG